MFRNSLIKSINKARFFSHSSKLYQKATIPKVTPELLSLKVGYIKECIQHPEADKLYVSKIITNPELSSPEIELTSDEQFLTVCSGLVNYIPRSEMVNKRVVLLTNLKASKMRGIKSQAMILAAEAKIPGTTEEVKVEVVNAPKSASVGESLFFKSFVNSKEPSKLKSKNWQILQPRLFTDENGIVIYKDENGDSHKLMDSFDDVAYADTLKNATVR